MRSPALDNLLNPRQSAAYDCQAPGRRAHCCPARRTSCDDAQRGDCQVWSSRKPIPLRSRCACPSRCGPLLLLRAQRWGRVLAVSGTARCPSRPRSAARPGL